MLHLFAASVLAIVGLCVFPRLTLTIAAFVIHPILGVVTAVVLLCTL